MRKLIIASHAFRSDYSNAGFIKYARNINRLCSKKCTIYYDPLFGVHTDEDPDYDATEEGVVYLDTELDLLKDIQDYWNDLISEVEMEVGDLSLDLLTKELLLPIRRMTEMNYDNYKSYSKKFYYQFSSPLDINKAMHNFGYEVLLTNLSIACGLQARYPHDYDFEFLVPRGQILEQLLGNIGVQWRENIIFRKWDPRHKPFLAGYWKGKGKSREYGKFYLYLFSGGDTEGDKEIPADGLISDRYGLAWFSGTICKHILTFQKHYFSYAVASKPDLPRSIEYTIYRKAGMGHYTIGSEVSEIELDY